MTFMPHADLNEARSHYAALRQLIIHQEGGWADKESLRKLDRLCGLVNNAVDDAECRARMESIQAFANDLYSTTGHLRWTRKETSGADFLRLWILRELDAFWSRLDLLDAMRHGGAGQDPDATIPGRRP
jgi:hypothetical protein